MKIHLLKLTFLMAMLSTMSWSCERSNSGKDKGNAEQVSESNVDKKAQEDPIILFFGNSITAGYGIELEQAFPNLIQQRLDSLGYSYKVVNAGLSGETTAGGLNRIEWVLQTVPDIFVLELGANDGLRGLDLKETHKNLVGIINKVREVNPDVRIILAGMMVPPNMGSSYADEFEKVFTEVAKEKDVQLIPFILDRVAGNPELNLPDGIHPTPEGHEIVAEIVWQELQPLLEKKKVL